jgi:hypothetical protein
MSVSIARRLHQGLHALPGMPPHTEAARLNARREPAHPAAGRRPGPAKDRRPGLAAGQRHGLASPDAHHARPPRVLVGWQTWLGQRFKGHV